MDTAAEGQYWKKVILSLAEVTTYPGFDKINDILQPIPGRRSLHDFRHSIRVMFWVAHLYHLSNEHSEPIPVDELRAALYAAALHDSARVHDFVDSRHGADAAKANWKFVESVLPKELADRCLLAISCHSVNKSPTQSDAIWQLLKDADALDRARIGPPRLFDGCDIRRLNTPLMKNKQDLAERLSWDAMDLIKMTSTIKWTEHPYKDFCIQIYNLVINNTFLRSRVPIR